MANKKNLILTILLLIGCFALAWYVNFETDSYIRRVVNLCMVYAIIGLSMNLTNGFTGQFSLGQAGFMAIGAYVVGIFTVPVALRPAVFYAAPMNPLILYAAMAGAYCRWLIGGFSRFSDWNACTETSR